MNLWKTALRFLDSWIMSILFSFLCLCSNWFSYFNFEYLFICDDELKWMIFNEKCIELFLLQLRQNNNDVWINFTRIPVILHPSSSILQVVWPLANSRLPLKCHCRILDYVDAGWFQKHVQHFIFLVLFEILVVWYQMFDW